MIQEVQALLDEYATWLKDKTSLRQLDGWVEITTPYVDRHNDYLQIYVRRQNGGFVLTDDGYVLSDLEMSGCTLETPKRQALLSMTLNGFGVRDEDARLEVVATSQNFSQRKHNLVQAMLAVNDLFCLASPTVTTLFYEDVVKWLDGARIRYTANIKLPGKSGYDHHFDFVIPKSSRQPERILKTINRPSKDTAQSAAFAWIDTRDARREALLADSRAYAILNDSEGGVSPAVVEALRSYEVRPIPWSQRESVREELAA